jgi:hypothetical protein
MVSHSLRSSSTKVDPSSRPMVLPYYRSPLWMPATTVEPSPPLSTAAPTLTHPLTVGRLSWREFCHPTLLGRMASPPWCLCCRPATPRPPESHHGPRCHRRRERGDYAPRCARCAGQADLAVRLRQLAKALGREGQPGTVH